VAVQGERIAGGFILITGIAGIRCAVRQNAVAWCSTETNAAMRPWRGFMAGMSFGCRARSMRCWRGSHKAELSV
jgi:hypothetical protein